MYPIWRQSKKNNNAEELFFKVEGLLCKHNVGKLKLFTATFGIDGEQIKASEGSTDLKYIIIKVLEGKLDEEGKADEEKCDMFKHMIEVTATGLEPTTT